jgi:membrane carboxypeptidase/penicillin-binding protein PbpC
VYYLDPVENYYYSKFSGENLSLPASSLQMNEFVSSLNIVYPEANSVIMVPKKLDGNYSGVELKANTATKQGSLFWFLNGIFLQKTEAPHHISVNLEEGEYALLINDALGNKDELNFTVVRR